jgi:hypothetical protein
MPVSNRHKILISVILFLFGFVFAWSGWSVYQSEQAYGRDGAFADGVILRKRSEDRRDNEDRRKVHRYYYLTYSFESDNGDQLESESSVSAEKYESVSINDPIKVQYLKNTPGTSRVAGEQAGSMVLVVGFIVIGIVIFVAGVLLLRTVLRP